jgi:hypothetical protein
MNDHYISARARSRIPGPASYLLDRKAFRMRFATKVFYAAAHPSTVAWPQRSF